MIRRCVALWLAMCCVVFSVQHARAQGITIALSSTAAQIFVLGRQMHFENLSTAHGDPVARIDDSGLASLLATVGARTDWQPGTRFVAITRADGTLITFTVNSNAVSVGDQTRPISFGPFYYGTQLYLPLLAVAQALGLEVHRFAGGYAFVPQIISVNRKIGLRRTIVEVHASAPLEWRSSFAGNARDRELVLQFPGFAIRAPSKILLGGREAVKARVEQHGPPGFPIASLSIDARRGVRFATHRLMGGSSMDVILARSENDLGYVPAVQPSAIQILERPSATRTNAPPQNTPAPVSQTPGPAPSSTLAPVPTAQPVPEVTDNGSAPPSAGTSSPASDNSGALPGPSALASPMQKITDVFVNDTTTGSRITLVVTGPVTWEWHRLGEPDNRFWVDIQPAVLVGPAQDFVVKLPFVQTVKVSQHQLTPAQIVRVSINPTQPIDVRIGGVEGSPDQLGIEISTQPPTADAPTSGSGMLAVSVPTPRPVVVKRVPTQPNLIVIDPGHGGNDPGAINRGLGLVESHITLAVAEKLRSLLQKKGWRVALTREGDYEVGDPDGDDKQELQSRCDIANAAGARLFVSVHVNSSVSSEPNGLTTYYWRGDDKILAQTIQSDTLASTKISDDGVHRENFYVIHHTFMPAVLVEAAYLSNWHDGSLLEQQSFLDKVAAGIASGIEDFTGGPSPQ